MLLRSLEWAYARAVEGVPGAHSARQLGDEYLSGDGSLDERVDRLIRYQVAKSSVSGFVTGVGGLMALPITLPASITSVMYVQLRLIAAVAHMGGHSLESDRVRTLAYACLLGNAAKDVVKEAGVVVGTRAARHALERLSARALVSLNRKVSERLLARFAVKGVAQLSRMAPVAGGVMGAALDGAATYAVGRVARRTFIEC